MSDKLKPCPCGEVPEKLECGSPYFHGQVDVYGSCCSRWMTLVRIVPSKKGAALYEEMVKAWNDAPRGEK